MYGFDVKDRGKEGRRVGVREGNTEPSTAEAAWQGNWQQRRERAAQFLASVDASIGGRRRRRSSGVMW